MAHKKGVGSTDNGRDSQSKRLGVKLFGGEFARAGNIIVRQRGTKFHAGENTYLGKDFTLHAKADGYVTFTKKRNNRTYISVLPTQNVVEEKLDVAPAKQKAAPKKAAPAVAKVEEAAPVEAKKAPKSTAKAAAGDDLKKVEGIGPKIAEIFNNGGINTFAELAATDVAKLKELLEAAGSRYKSKNPSTWPMQAGLAAEGKWDELKELQDKLDGGVVVSSEEE